MGDSLMLMMAEVTAACSARPRALSAAMVAWVFFFFFDAFDVLDECVVRFTFCDLSLEDVELWSL